MLRVIDVSLARVWLTLAICGGVILLRITVARILHALIRAHPRNRVVFWTDQSVSVAALITILVACAAIWVDDPARLTSIFKDRISRKILADLDAAGIDIASTTMEVTVMNRS
jgi:hypothetical protein